VMGIGFMLKPAGFFDRNPGLDVPPPTSHCCADQSASRAPSTAGERSNPS
jgi:hypothetical protein